MSLIKRLKRLNTSTMLKLVSLAFLLPIVYLLFYSIIGYNGYITFGTKERIGAEMLKELKGILVGSLIYQTSNGSAKINLDKEFESLSNLSQKFESEINLSVSELSKKNKVNLSPEMLHKKWKEIDNGKFDNDKIASLINDVASLYAYIGDVSNLILDPDLDSYYLMDVALLAMPQVVRRIFDLKLYLNEVAEENITFDNRIYLSVFNSSLKQADIDRINASIATALDQDEAFYGISKTLNSSINPALNDFNSNSDKLLSLSSTAMTTESNIDISGINNALENTLQTSYNIWDKSIEELIVLLDIRIKAYKSGRLNTIILASALVVFAYVFLFFVSNTITKKISSTAQFMKYLSIGDIAKANQIYNNLENEFY